MKNQVQPKADENAYQSGSISVDAANELKRRSSNRSIKRKRFDDEIVEYSLGIPPTQMHRIGRTRTHSQTYPSPSTPSTIAGTAAAAATTSIDPSTPISLPTTITTPTTTAISTPQVPSTPNPIHTTITSTPIAGIGSQIPKPASPFLSASSVSGSGGGAASGGSISTANTGPALAAMQEKRRIMKGNRRSKKSRSGNQVSTKDLGRWKAIDDLALIIGVQQTNDLRMVHRGIKFSCKFTIAELQSRWYSLLYEEPISRIAVAAIKNLHPEIVESVHSRALYSVQEEEILGQIKSTETPTLEQFQELLDANVLGFYPARTAKSLSMHWHLMKQYSLLPDQNVPAACSKGGEPVLSFSDAEEQINDADLIDPRDEAFEIELALVDRKNKKEIRHLENEINRWSVLVDSLPGIGLAAEFDNQTLAVLRGRLVRFLMRSREITFGRTTKDQSVDVDLTLEGPSYKVSRKQGVIKMRSNGDFFITNEGKRAIYIDGIPLLQSNKTRLNNNCVVEIAGLRFIFLVNHDLIGAIRQESAKMNGPLN